MASSGLGLVSYFSMNTINAPTPPILSLQNLNIQRGDFILCKGVNLQLYAGQIAHLVGANGSGKTTLLMQLAGLLPLADLQEEVEEWEEWEKEEENLAEEDLEQDKIQPCHIRFCGADSLPIQPVYVSHQLGIHPDLTVKQNLQFLLDLYAVPSSPQAICEALAWVGLDGYEDIPCNQLSAGQTRRVNLARLKIMTPKHSKLWLLDEPFTALDLQMVAKLQNRLQAFVADGGAVLMTSHQAVSVADVVLDLDKLNFNEYLS